MPGKDRHRRPFPTNLSVRVRFCVKTIFGQVAAELVALALAERISSPEVIMPWRTPVDDVDDADLPSQSQPWWRCFCCSQVLESASLASLRGTVPKQDLGRVGDQRSQYSDTSERTDSTGCDSANALSAHHLAWYNADTARIEVRLCSSHWATRSRPSAARQTRSSPAGVRAPTSR